MRQSRLIPLASGLLLLGMAGCGPAPGPGKEIADSAHQQLDKAKQVETVLQQAASAQAATIEEQSK